ncbi:MAG: DUF302 domain-containing protein [Gammaproteobacteria bacterium]|nr:DUF302 domain-containing protein [Gammaproteobacteria bacterium]
MTYGFKVKVEGDVPHAVEQVTNALQDEGFGVLTEIDVQATLKKKLDIDRRPYRILGACNPALAHRALETEPDIGLLLPCNVVVQEEEDGSTSVAFIDPDAMLSVVKRDDIKSLATEVRVRLEKVRDVVSV